LKQAEYFREMLPEVIGYASWKYGVPIFPPFIVTDCDGISIEINVAYPQPQAFQSSQTSTVDESAYKAIRVIQS